MTGVRPVRRTMRAKPEDLLPTRASLLIRLKNWEDQVSWQRFFDTYGPLIYSAARRAGLTDFEAQEAVQATLIDVAKKMPGFQYDPALGQFKGWLLTLTRWRVLDQFRQRARIRTPGDGQKYPGGLHRHHPGCGLSDPFSLIR